MKGDLEGCAGCGGCPMGGESRDCAGCRGCGADLYEQSRLVCESDPEGNVTAYEAGEEEDPPQAEAGEQTGDFSAARRGTAGEEAGEAGEINKADEGTIKSAAKAGILNSAETGLENADNADGQAEQAAQGQAETGQAQEERNGTAGEETGAAGEINKAGEDTIKSAAEAGMMNGASDSAKADVLNREAAGGREDMSGMSGDFNNTQGYGGQNGNLNSAQSHQAAEQAAQTAGAVQPEGMAQAAQAAAQAAEQAAEQAAQASAQAAAQAQAQAAQASAQAEAGRQAAEAQMWQWQAQSWGQPGTQGQPAWQQGQPGPWQPGQGAPGAYPPPYYPPYGGYAPYGVYPGGPAYGGYASPNQEGNRVYRMPVQPRPQPEKKKTRKGLKWAALIAGMLCFMFIGAAISTIFILPLLKENGPSYSESPSPSGSGATPDGSATPEEGAQNEGIDTLGGVAPIIEDLYNPVPEIAEALQESVVGVNTKAIVEGRLVDYSRGTGIVVHTQGYILTNHHVVAGGSAYTVVLSDGKEYEAKYVGSDVTADIAVLKIEGVSLKAAPLGDSDDVRTGELSIALGNPAGGDDNLEGSVTVGYVSASKRELLFNGISQEFIQTDAALNPGNSGGPLINDKGEVIGVVTLKTLVSAYDENGYEIDAEGIGFAIPINAAKRIALEIIRGGSVKRPGIGISFYTITEETKEEYGGPVGGKYIDDFMEGSTAAEAGLQVGDIVIKCNGRSILEEEDALSKMVQASRVGDELKLTVIRDGTEMEFTIKVGDFNQMNPGDMN